jgi:alanine racemase
VTPRSEETLRWAEVDTTALRDNATAIRARLRPETRLMAMVKSNGYGHGAEIAARAALDGGATWLGVYTPDEALELRAAGLEAPLFVAGWSPPVTHRALVRAGIDFAVFDLEGARSAGAAGKEVGARARVHNKVDTGLSRLGVRPDDQDSLLRALDVVHASVDVVGVFTHYADAEHDGDFTHAQHERFLGAAAFSSERWPESLRHTAGSAAILNFPETHHDLVRLGIALYGYGAPETSDIELHPAMSVFANVAQVKTIEAGDSVGYGRTWRAERRTRVATVAIGYGQGVPRALSNRGQLVLAGLRCPIVGIVNMDQVSVDVSDVDEVRAGDAAMFFGERDGVRLGADEVAGIAGTIPHEILCGVSATVPRHAVGAADRANEGPPTAVP